MKKAKKQTQPGAARTVRRREKPWVPDTEEERILQAATIHLIRKVGGLLVATGLREMQVKGVRLWIIAVTLRYPTGHEGYVADLLYDGEEFILLTEPSVMDERIDRIASDPERLRKWNELQAAALQTTKR